jgi:outer membrane lipoprotein carrier protein
MEKQCFSFKRSIAVLLLLGITGQALAEAADPIKRLEHRLAHWDTMEGDFKQEIYDDIEELVDSTQGTVYLKKPGKLRWEVRSKDKSLIVSDGKQIWHYDPELEQATVDVFDPKGTSPLLFLTAKTQNLGEKFVVKEVSNALCDEKRAKACFEMKPRDPEAMFQWIRIGFEKENLLGLEFLDQLGQHGWITFSKMKVNKPMSDSLFRFTPPKGTDMVRRS